MFINLQDMFASSPELDKDAFRLEVSELDKKLDKYLKAILSNIDDISQPNSDKEGSQTE